jgi:acetyltransferase-like isoleucine patch superfamily enzyme
VNIKEVSFMTNNKMGRIPLSDKSKGLKKTRAIFNRILHCIARYLPMYPIHRVFLHRMRGVKIGNEVFIGSEVFIDDAEPDLVDIEDGVTIIARCSILAHSYYPTHLCEYFKDKEHLKGVTIKKGAYLGFGSIILPGVTVGENAIIGAGTVISKDVPASSTVIGQPPNYSVKEH